MTIADQIGSRWSGRGCPTGEMAAGGAGAPAGLARELHDSVTQLLYSQVLFSAPA